MYGRQVPVQIELENVHLRNLHSCSVHVKDNIPEQFNSNKIHLYTYQIWRVMTRILIQWVVKAAKICKVPK